MDTLELIKKAEEIYKSFGFPIVFLSGFIEMTPFGWAIPGGLIVAIAGFFAYGNAQSFAIIIILGWLGSWLTFLFSYILGRKTGHYLVKKLHQEKNAQRAETLLKNHGGVILTTSMLAGLTRFWIAYVAGEQKYNFGNFLFYSLTASLTWTSLQAIIGYLAGSERQNLERGIAALGILGWVFLIIAIASIIFSAKKEYRHFKKDSSRKKHI